MEIAHRQEFLSACLHPLGSGGGLAFWTMTIPARVVCNLLMTALITLFEMAAQSGSAAIHNVLYHAALCCRQRLQKRSIQATEDIGQFYLLVVHSCGSRVRLVGSKSKGLIARRSAILETWR